MRSISIEQKGQPRLDCPHYPSSGRWLQGLYALSVLLLLAATNAGAREIPRIEAQPEDGPAFLVGSFIPQYAEPNPAHPSLTELSELSFELGRTTDGYVAPRAGVPSIRFQLRQLESVPGQRIYASGIRAVCEQLVAEFTRRGFDGVLVRPHAGDIEPISNRDLRQRGETSVRIVMWTSKRSGEAFEIARALPTRSDGAAYPVDEIVLEYAESHQGHPSLRTIERTVLYLGRTSQGWVAPRQGIPAVPFYLRHLSVAPVQHIYASGIRFINEQLVAALNAQGLIGVVVLPHVDDVDPSTGNDLRPDDDQRLHLVIWTGRLQELRTFASGTRIPADSRLNHPAHQHLRDHSPLRPVSAGATAGPDLLREQELSEYVARLNRHPGRHVDVALAPAREPGGVYLDYLITEDKPWSAYSQFNNTGTDQTTEARQRFGFTHTQLTGRDDILRVEYVTGSFDEVSAVSGSYEAPFFGVDDVRWRVYGNQSSFDASTIGLGIPDFEGDQWGVGGELIANVFQRGELFLDVLAGARWQDIAVDNPFALSDAEDSFFLPYVGLVVERATETSTLLADLRLEHNLDSLANTEVDDITQAGGLGRLDADGDWTVLRWATSFTGYVEPWLDRDLSASQDMLETAKLAHEIALFFRGQHALGNRLIPQEQRVAGGFYTVRGYEEALTNGDSVLIGTAEYRFHLPRMLSVQTVPKQLPFFGSFRVAPQQRFGRPDWDLIVRAFLDAAHVMQSDRKSFEDDETLVGAGFGLELKLRRNLSARIDFGFALDENRQLGVDRGDSQVHFAVTGLY